MDHYSPRVLSLFRQDRMSRLIKSVTPVLQNVVHKYSEVFIDIPFLISQCNHAFVGRRAVGSGIPFQNKIFQG